MHGAGGFDTARTFYFAIKDVWRAGDLVMWDKRCTLHAHTDFPPTWSACCGA